MLLPRGHISSSHFRKINWLSGEHRVELCTSNTVFKCWKGIAPSYLNDMFMPSLTNNNTRSQIALDIPPCRTNKGQKSMSFLGPKVWNKVNSNMKKAAITSSFTHRFKKKFLVTNFIFFFFFYFYYYYYFFFFFFGKLIFSTIFISGTLMEVRIVLDLF